MQGFWKVSWARLAAFIFASQSSGMDISPAQVKVARALLGWSQSGLALKAGIDGPTLREFEDQNVGGRPRQEAISALRQTLEAAGIIFTQVSVTLSNEKGGL
jgi:hypothetical protein